MATFNWLHFSDLHFGIENQEWLWPTYREEFFKNLSKLHDQTGPWNAVIFSGDLTYSGKKEEFEKLSETLDKIWAHFRSLGSWPPLITVPGNHDLLRPSTENAAVKAFRHWHEDADLRKQFWGSSKNEYRATINECFYNYTIWLQTLSLPHPKEIKYGLLPGDFSIVLEIGGASFGIIGINTAFLQLTKDDYKGQLDIHENQIHNACSGDPVSWCKEKDITLLISHHGPEWLHPNAQARLKGEISPPGRFFAHLYGHMHEPFTASISEGGAEIRRYLQGPSLFGLKTYRERVKRIHGYTACRIEINKTETEGRLQLWPRISVQTYAGHLRIGPDQQFDLNEADSIVWTFEPKKPPEAEIQKTESLSLHLEAPTNEALRKRNRIK